MAENGILDYQGMNQAIYRGATSNIIVDTQSMSIEIGAGNTSHTSNLHFECNHDANVASIKLNSNVVTEFPRSKKLIKYPRVNLTQNALNNGYAAAASSENTVATRYAFKAFNTNLNDEWQMSGVNNDPNEGYNITSPFDANSNSPTISVVNGGSYTGAWIKIQLPDAIRVLKVRMYLDDASSSRRPDKAVILGSNDDTNWYDLSGEFLIAFGSSGWANVDINSPVAYYKHIKLLVTSLASEIGVTTGQLQLRELEYYGLPEYDPDAAGVDVVVKSVPNVPNTDWLEVYYDAKDLGNGAVTNPISGLGGTTNNGTAYGDTQISDGAFVFDGNGDYIETTVTTETGNWPHSYSFWMKADTDASSGAHFVALGTEGGAGSGTSVIRFSNDEFLWYFWSNDVYFKSSNLRGRWVHVVGTYDGGSVATSRKIFINNVEVPIRSTAGTIGSLNLTTTSTPFKIGSKLDNTNTFKGSIANVRLFNRALTTDEIHQLYAYQKEYFGHGDLSMTLKAGRLGIGTSEPKAALDVRGDLFGPGIIQVQSTTFDGITSGSSISFTTLSGLTTSITPKRTGSKILVLLNLFWSGTDDAYFQGNVKKDGTVLVKQEGSVGSASKTSFGMLNYDRPLYFLGNIGFSYLDDTNIGTEPIEYTVEVRNRAINAPGYTNWYINYTSSTSDANRLTAVSTLTLIEIQQ